MSFERDLVTVFMFSMAACAYTAYFRTSSLMDEIDDLNDRLDSMESERDQQTLKNDQNNLPSDHPLPQKTPKKSKKIKK